MASPFKSDVVTFLTTPIVTVTDLISISSVTTNSINDLSIDTFKQLKDELKTTTVLAATEVVSSTQFVITTTESEFILNEITTDEIDTMISTEPIINTTSPLLPTNQETESTTTEAFENSSSTEILTTTTVKISDIESTNQVETTTTESIVELSSTQLINTSTEAFKESIEISFETTVPIKSTILLTELTTSEPVSDLVTESIETSTIPLLITKFVSDHSELDLDLETTTILSLTTVQLLDSATTPQTLGDLIYKNNKEVTSLIRFKTDYLAACYSNDKQVLILNIKNKSIENNITLRNRCTALTSMQDDTIAVADLSCIRIINETTVIRTININCSDNDEEITYLIQIPQYLVSGKRSGSIELWDIQQLESNYSIITLYGHTAAIRSLVYIESKNWIVSTSDDSKIIIWYVKSGQMYKILNNHSMPVVSLVVLGNSSLVSASLDSTIIVWNIETESVINRFNYSTPIVSLALFDQQTLVIFFNNKTIGFQDVSSNKVEYLTEYDNVKLSVAYSNDSFIFGSMSGCIKILKMKELNSGFLD